ncbi:E3 ubiquitin-protein ligase MARCHF7 isoform X1 [Drosophila rhopaloa]|uniref:E3 ubiquitin-protein ligase MARCH7 isoform X1 n=2 Tax=Drosophila rhopaloa TaxID=1041015 RepID=A0A6P4E4J8_DRORH|nr:E3 ubiquitin-protein ligase MARCHF7 isoform X1 [Drosophila rhopaloa]
MSHHQHVISESAAFRLLNGLVATGSATPLAVQPPTAPPAEVSCSPEISPPTGQLPGGTPTASMAALEISSARQRMLPPITRRSSQESVHSANENGNSCRICRWNRSDMEIIKCPCSCKGSVGFIHLKCLKRWIMHRRDNRCEICNAVFDISEERVSLKQMMRTFCCGRCCGLIVKHLLFSASLMPLAHIILQQVLQCMDNLNQGSTEQLTVQEVFVASCALLTSSALFFHFFEFVTTRCLLIRNILRHWWMFGSTSDFALVEIEDDSVDLF